MYQSQGKKRYPRLEFITPCQNITFYSYLDLGGLSVKLTNQLRFASRQTVLLVKNFTLDLMQPILNNDNA